MAKFSSYRIGKPWRGSQLDRRNYITYLVDNKRIGKKRDDTVDGAITYDADGGYITDNSGNVITY